MKASRAVGMSVHILLDLYQTLFQYSLEHGYDSEQGEGYFSSPLNQSADYNVKLWWVEAEALFSSLSLYNQTGNSKYRDVFEQTYSFVEKHMSDWESVQNYITSMPKPLLDHPRLDHHKTAYYQGRAMIGCLEILKSHLDESRSKIKPIPH